LGIRIATSLPDELEALAHEVIGACIEVHKRLGAGLLEGIYSKAVAAELNCRGVSFESELAIPVMYRGLCLCHHRLDLFVESRIVVEIKSVERLLPIHQAQVLTYLRLSGARLGLLLNFNVEVLKQGLRRIVL